MAGAVFDFSRSPLAIAWEPAGESFFGLPGLDVFGAHMRSVHLLFLTAATLFLGWRGFIMGAAIWVAYKLTSGMAITIPYMAAFLCKSTYGSHILLMKAPFAQLQRVPLLWRRQDNGADTTQKTSFIDLVWSAHIMQAIPAASLLALCIYLLSHLQEAAVCCTVYTSMSHILMTVMIPESAVSSPGKVLPMFGKCSSFRYMHAPRLFVCF